jgi:hypothetical protein
MNMIYLNDLMCIYDRLQVDYVGDGAIEMMSATRFCLGNSSARITSQELTSPKSFQ